MVGCQGSPPVLPIFLFDHKPGEFQATAQSSIVPADAALELLWNDGDFTEGPAAARGPGADGDIYFSDIGNRIYKYDVQSGDVSVYREPSGRSNGLLFDAKGRLFAAEGANTGGARRISVTDPDGSHQTYADRWNGKRFNSPNDLMITRLGDVYFTDPRYVGDEPREIDFEGVFVIKPDGHVKLATKEVQKPNGIVISPDGSTVYVADNNPNGNRQLLAFSRLIDGTLFSKRVLYTFGQGERGIDGMAVDTLGNVYATAGNGDKAGVYVFAETGAQLAFIKTPGSPTNCTFGVGEEQSTLYITARGPLQVESNKPQRYGLFRIKLKIPGFHVGG